MIYVILTLRWSGLWRISETLPYYLFTVFEYFWSDMLQILTLPKYRQKFVNLLFFT